MELKEMAQNITTSTIIHEFYISIISASSTTK